MNNWYHAPAKVLIVDDDHDLLNLVSFAYHNAGYETVCASNGLEALQAFERERFSLLVLDINMPALNGLQVCASVRNHSNVPVLVLSARDEEHDLLEALDAGADAYLVKPFSPRTLIARTQALLRRAASEDLPNAPSDRFKLDVNEMSLRHSSGEIRLTKLEMRVLRLLMLNAGRLVSAGDLVSEVWSAYHGANRNMLKQVIFRLRRKLNANPDALHALTSHNGGYMWTEHGTAHSVALEGNATPAAAST